MSRVYNEITAIIREMRLIPEDIANTKRLWTILLDNPHDASYLLGIMIREADRIGRLEERHAIMDVLRHVPYSLRYSPSSSEETARSSTSAAGPA